MRVVPRISRCLLPMPARGRITREGPSLSDRARVVEVFSSIQGESELVGLRQVVVRFFGCNIRCDYCDSPETLTGKPKCRVERTPGRRDFLVVENPVERDR